MADLKDLGKAIIEEITRRVGSAQLRAGMDFGELLKAYALIERAQGLTAEHEYGAMGDLQLIAHLQEVTGQSIAEISTWLFRERPPKAPLIED